MTKHKRTISYIPYSFVPNHTPTIEALSLTKLSGREFRVVLFIMRQTDGYLRNEDRISPAFFESKTGIDKPHLSNVLGRLKALNIISITPSKPPTYSVNPPQAWKNEAFTKSGEPDSPNPVRKFTKSGEKQLYPKDNLKKTNYRSIDNNDPDKYIKGKYGKMVRR